MSRILVLCYSSYGHIRDLAGAHFEGRHVAEIAARLVAADKLQAEQEIA